jgi:hypothetical protein
MRKIMMKSINILDTMPQIRMKTNGLATGSIRKGYFVVDGIGIYFY